MLKIYHAKSKEDIEVTKQFFFEYMEYLKLYFQELADFSWLIEYYKDFEKEINSLPGKYQSPRGSIILVRNEDEPIGCVALEGKKDGICEMQRLFIRRNYRRQGIARKLCKAAIEQAKTSGYTRLQLHTAIEPPKELYRSLGFYEIAPTEDIPLDTVVFMELKLDS